MNDHQKKRIEEKIWRLLQDHKSIYEKYQPTFSYSIEDDTYFMHKELLERLPYDVQVELKKILKIYS